MSGTKLAPSKAFLLSNETSEVKIIFHFRVNDDNKLAYFFQKKGGTTKLRLFVLSHNTFLYCASEDEEFFY